MAEVRALGEIGAGTYRVTGLHPAPVRVGCYSRADQLSSPITHEQMPPSASTPPADPLTFLDLAEVVLGEATGPMTIEEIWKAAETAGHIARLRGQGKTPAHTLGARLYLDVKRDNSRFTSVGHRPARFELRKKGAAQVHAAPAGVVAAQNAPVAAGVPHAVAPPTKVTPAPIVERELHPVLVRCARDEFRAHCLTVYHEKSAKAQPKKNEWLHPDIVGFTLETDGWNPAAKEIAARFGSRAVSIYSFEVKRDLDFPSLRQSFFQAVSNSSWAHEGYLVVWRLEPDPEFRDELRRLSQSFGIGVIQLHVGQPGAYDLLHSARRREEIDWATVNRLAETNEDFAHFLESVKDSLHIHKVVASKFDSPASDQYLEDLAKRT